MHESAHGITEANRRQFLDAVERLVLEISGAVHGSLRHDQAYRFMRIASYIERADMTSRVLDVPSSMLSSESNTGGMLPFENRDWSAVLHSRSAMQMYRRHVRQPVSAEGCLNFLLNDAELPSAFRFCLIRLDRNLENFKHNREARKTVSELFRQLDNADIPAIAMDAQLRHRFLDDLQLSLNRTGDAIAKTYFPPAEELA